MNLTETILAGLQTACPGAVTTSGEFRGELSLTIRKQDITAVCRHLKTDPALLFDMVVDICGVDYYRPVDRFEVVYHLYSLTHRAYLRLKVPVDETDPNVDTVSGVWKGAGWHERETYDMYGIRFTGHPDLRRMYMPEEFAHHPLRKDFPLMGIPDSLPLPRS